MDQQFLLIAIIVYLVWINHKDFILDKAGYFFPFLNRDEVSDDLANLLDLWKIRENFDSEDKTYEELTKSIENVVRKDAPVGVKTNVKK